MEFTAPSKTASVPLTQNGLYIGTITRLDDEGAPFVEIPAILNNFSFGPCVFSSYTGGQIPTVGQKVICGFLNNALDEVVVLGPVLGLTAFGIPKAVQATNLGDPVASGASDGYGISLSLSGDGKRLAVGANLDDTAILNGGRGQVWEWNGTTWVQLGDDFLGTISQGQLGRSIDLNLDGSVVAVGGEAANSYAGQVKVLDYVNGAWVERTSLAGSANTYFGCSVALSDDGSRVAIGAYKDDTAAGDAGAVYVYDWDGSAWSQVGSAILGGDAAVDYFGYSVDITADGNRIVAGAYQDDDGATLNAGSVSVYDWDGSSWTQVGSTVYGPAGDDDLGQTVSITPDGQTWVAGGKRDDFRGIAEVYSWDGSGWAQKGLSIVGANTSDYLGDAVGIAEDGDRIVVGAFGDDSVGQSAGAVRVYDWNGSNWVPVGGTFVGSDLYRNFGEAVGISNDGLVIAGSNWSSTKEWRAFGFF